jgi:uncharacterized protein
MEYKSVKGFTGLGQIGFLFAFLGLGVVLAGAVQIFITKQMQPIGLNLDDNAAVIKATLAPENVNLARVSQFLGTLMLFFVPSVLWSFASNGKSPFWLGFNKYVNFPQIILGFFIMLLANFAATPFADFSKYVLHFFPSIDSTAKSMEATYASLTTALSNLTSPSEFFVALFIMALLPAMFEEVFFRGVLQNFLVRWWKQPIVAIIVTSILFSWVHSSIYLFLSRAVLGFVLGYMFYKTKNIWVNIAAHFINNTLALTALYAVKNSTGKVDLDKIEPNVHWALGLSAIAVIVAAFIFLEKFSKENRTKIEAKEHLFTNNSLNTNSLQ